MTRTLVLLVGLFASSVASADVVRVVIARGQRIVVEGDHLVVSGGGETFEAEDRVVFEASGQFVAAGRSVDTKFIIEEATGGALRLNGVPIIGGGEVAVSKGTVVGIDAIDLERYVASVVGAEMPSSWPAAALEAQAVAARTYVLSRRRLHPEQPYDVEATVRSQVYTGESSISAKSLAAVDATRGLVVLFDGDLAETYFFASCAGSTESATDAFGKGAPYLTPVSCETEETKGLAWSHAISLDRLSAVLRSRGRIAADVTGVEATRRTSTGRLAAVTIRTHGGTTRMSAEELREAIGTSVLPSLDIAIAEHHRDIVFSGRGAGHGVGLCQWGAKELALRGATATQILRHYYPGTSVTQRPAESPTLARSARTASDPLAKLMPR